MNTRNQQGTTGGGEQSPPVVWVVVNAHSLVCALRQTERAALAFQRTYGAPTSTYPVRFGNGAPSFEHGRPAYLERPSLVETLQTLGWHAPTPESTVAPCEPTDGRSSGITAVLGPNGHVGQIAKPHRVTGSIPPVGFAKYLHGRMLARIGR